MTLGGLSPPGTGGEFGYPVQYKKIKRTSDVRNLSG